VGKDAETFYYMLRAALSDEETAVYDPKAAGVASLLAALARRRAEHGKLCSARSESAEPY